MTGNESRTLPYDCCMTRMIERIHDYDPYKDDEHVMKTVKIAYLRSLTERGFFPRPPPDRW